jgi:hypothetical protein
MRSRIVSPKSTGIMPDTGEETASTDCVLALITNRLGTDFKKEIDRVVSMEVKELTLP